MCDIKRYEGETEEELLYRVGQMKDEIGSWEAVKDIMNELLGYDYGEAKYRKQYAIIKKVVENTESCSNDEYLDELKELKYELKSERIKIQTLNLERNRLDREGARQELFYEQINLDMFDNGDDLVSVYKRVNIKTGKEDLAEKNFIKYQKLQDYYLFHHLVRYLVC